MMNRRGPYQIMKIVTPTTYDLYDSDDPEEVLTRVHSSDLTHFVAGSRGETPKMRRRGGRPRKPTHGQVLVKLHTCQPKTFF
ncbi:hypothetical protein Trydic_g1757 [Trypoxylus dichotomus]